MAEINTMCKAILLQLKINKKHLRESRTNNKGNFRETIFKR